MYDKDTSSTRVYFELVIIGRRWNLSVSIELNMKSLKCW